MKRHCNSRCGWITNIKHPVFLPRTDIILFLFVSCCCRMKLDTREGIWLPSTWPKSCLCFQYESSFPLPNDGFYQRFKTSERFSVLLYLSCYFRSFQRKYRNALCAAVLSSCHRAHANFQHLHLFRGIDLIATMNTRLPNEIYCEVLVFQIRITLAIFGRIFSLFSSRPCGNMTAYFELKWYTRLSLFLSVLLLSIYGITQFTSGSLLNEYISWLCGINNKN